MAEQLDNLLGVRDVCRAEGCSRSTLYERIARNEFPPPLPNVNGRAPNKWRESVVAAHQRAKFARLEELQKKRQSERAAAA